ncbi:hypothetical protein F4808DRAFT_216865 [Astrocystis sublimbata]|nr:hypothetical protein F4808DRAFT_216865 [Astrocystis sublimbata]
MNLSSVALSAQDLHVALSEFSALLNAEQRRDLSNIRKIPDPDSIFIFTAELDYRNRSRKGQSLASRFTKVLLSTRDFCTALEALGPSQPGTAALVWGSVRLTIQIALNYKCYYEPISELFLRLGQSCPLFTEYGSLYPNSKLLQQSVVTFFTSMIRCCTRVIDAIQVPWHTDSLEAFEQEFQHHVNTSRIMSLGVKDSLITARAHFDAQVSLEYRQMSKTIVTKVSLDRKQRLLDVFCSHRPEKLLKQNQRKRFADTASWVVESTEFKSWMDTRDARLLWCSGKAGTGKSVIAASVIDHMVLEKRNSGCDMSYIFVDSNDPQSLKAETIMRSLLRQRLPPATRLSDRIEDKLRHLNENGDLPQIALFLAGIMNASSRPSYIVIDGLDKCSTRTRGRLLRALSWLTLNTTSKLFLSSKEEMVEEIQSHFPAIGRISMDNRAVKDDMAQYIYHKLNKEPTLGNSAAITEFTKEIIEGADGVFLQVFLLVEELRAQVDDKAIIDAVATLPKNMEDTVRRVLHRISSREDSDLALNALAWVASVVRPLSIDELQEAMVIEIGQQYTNPERLCRDAKDIIASCQGLLCIDEEDGSVTFTHQSIRQFLVEHRFPSGDQGLPSYDSTAFHIDIEGADHFVGEICVTYLHFSDFQSALDQLPEPMDLDNPHDMALVGPTLREVCKDTHPFLKYASTYWIHHTKNFRPKRSQTWDLWEQMIVGGQPLAKTPWQAGDHVAMCQWAMNERCEALLDLIDSFDESRRPVGWDIICDAIKCNHPAILGVSLRSLPNGTFNYVFTTSAFKTSTSACLYIADRLLAAGADVDSTNWDMVMLQEAAREGYLEVINTILATEKPALDPRRLGLALYEASRKGRLNAVEMLLQAAGNEPHMLRDMQTQLQAAFFNAARNGYVEIVEALIRSGANVDTIFNDYSQTALQKAARNGRRGIVEALLKQRAGVNFSDRRGNTALMMAAKRGFTDIVQWLLDAGASVNPKNKKGDTAIMKAERRWM